MYEKCKKIRRHLSGVGSQHIDILDIAGIHLSVKNSGDKETWTLVAPRVERAAPTARSENLKWAISAT